MISKISDEFISRLQNFYAGNEDALDNDLDALYCQCRILQHPDARARVVLGKMFIQPMCRFNKIMKGRSPFEIARLVRNGRDVKITAYEDGCTVFSNTGFNVNRHYFFFDGNDDLISTDSINYDFFLNDRNLLHIVRLACNDENFLNSLSDGAREIIHDYI